MRIALQSGSGENQYVCTVSPEPPTQDPLVAGPERSRQASLSSRDAGSHDALCDPGDSQPPASSGWHMSPHDGALGVPSQHSTLAAPSKPRQSSQPPASTATNPQPTPASSEAMRLAEELTGTCSRR